MRPLGPPPHDDDADAPIAAVTDTRSFWDHLGATRAEEYAGLDILPLAPEPLPLPEPLEGDSALLADLPDPGMASLSDVLEAEPLHTGGTLAPDQPANSASPVAMAAAQAQEHSAHEVAPFFTDPPRPRRRSRGPSRLRYRLQRIWLTPVYRLAITVGTPVAALACGVALFFSDAGRREAVLGTITAMHSAVIERPEFMVTTLELPPTAPELEPALRAKLEPELPQSSFRLDLDALRERVEELDWVRSADLRLMADGGLSVSVTERSPALVWRSDEGLELLDAGGVRVARVAHRGARADLPLIAGRGADAHVAEALELLDAASPLGERLLGLLRVGERRWDLVLDRDQRIQLPERGALPALERIVALNQAQDLLARDVIHADMRNPARPVLRISQGAMDTLRDIRSQSME